MMRGMKQAANDMTNAPKNPFIVTISGDLGSGKSVLTSALVERWGAERYSTGLVQRKLAESLGITTLELNKRAETDKSIDDQIDSVFRSLAQTPTNLVVDSRMAFHFLPQSFRIKLEVHPQVAAQRIKGDTSRVGEGVYTTPEEVEAAIVARKSSERERFIRYYNTDIEDHVGYDLVINTTHVPTADVNAIANKSIGHWLDKKQHGKVWVSPKYLYCQKDTDTLSKQVIENNLGALMATGDADVWPLNAVHAAKVGPRYIVTHGAEWVAAALQANVVLMPVFLSSQMAEEPDAKINEKWEKAFNYKHM